MGLRTLVSKYVSEYEEGDNDDQTAGTGIEVVAGLVTAKGSFSPVHSAPPVQLEKHEFLQRYM